MNDLYSVILLKIIISLLLKEIILYKLFLSYYPGFVPSLKIEFTEMYFLPDSEPISMKRDNTNTIP